MPLSIRSDLVLDDAYFNYINIKINIKIITEYPTGETKFKEVTDAIKYSYHITNRLVSPINSPMTPNSKHLKLP